MKLFFDVSYNRFMKRLFLIGIVLLIWMGCPVINPAIAITIQEEEKISQEFLKMALARYRLVSDPCIVSYIREVGARVAAVVPESPFAFQFYVIQDSTLNAFASPAGHIFIHSGLLTTLSSEEELSGIIAHEVAHVYCRHISDMIDRSKKTGVATLAGIAAGILAGLAGNSEVASAVTIGSLAANQADMLAYSRENEHQADQIGLRFHRAAGYDGSGLVSALEAIRQKRWFGPEQIPTYLTTHPGTEERIVTLKMMLEKREMFPQGNLTVDSDAFSKAQVQAVAQTYPPDQALRRFENILSDQGTTEDPIRIYGYGLALARSGSPEAAVFQFRQALKQRPFDPEILLACGAASFQSGDIPAALEMLSGLTVPDCRAAELHLYLARCRMAQGNYDMAIQLLTSVESQAPDTPMLHFYLGKAYHGMGDAGASHYYIGRYYEKQRRGEIALYHYKTSLSLNPDEKRFADLKDRIERISRMRRKAVSKKQNASFF